jgi:RNA polymerase sigma factor (sigma-70 family)
MDRVLLERLRAGDAAAFAEVYGAERVRLFSFLVRLCRDRHLAADLFQNTWLKLARHAASLREDTDLGAWLFTVARNEWRSHCRVQMIDLSHFLALDQEQGAWPPGHAPGDDAGLDALEAALARLGDADRELLLLIGVEGLELRRAASVLGVSYDAVRQRLSRARQRLAEHLAELGALPEPARCPK